MSVSLSEQAASEVKRIIEQDEQLNGATVLRVEIAGGGCSGFAYRLGWDSDTSERDRVSDHHGVKLAYDKKFDTFLDGTVIDFYEDIGRRGFVFNNPNVVKTCGCGSSFHV